MDQPASITIAGSGSGALFDKFHSLYHLGKQCLYLVDGFVLYSVPCNQLPCSWSKMQLHETSRAAPLQPTTILKNAEAINAKASQEVRPGPA